MTAEEKAMALFKDMVRQKMKEKKVEAYNRLPYSKKSMTKKQLNLKPAEAWAAGFEANSSLIHLDLSHNYFDSRELVEINKGLSENHTILGIHLGGNEGDIDAFGFIKPKKDAFKRDPRDPKNLNKRKIVDIEDVGKMSIFTRIKPSLQQGVIKNLKRIEM